MRERERDREKGRGGRRGRDEGRGGERRRKRESGSKMMVFTNTYCIYRYPVASLTSYHAITKDRKLSVILRKLLIPSCHKYVTALPGETARHTGRLE